jgi:Fe-S-cluster containining protein
MRMACTLYLHIEFASKTPWSINLPFQCTKCGNCCKLEDFLSAGKLNAKPEEHLEVHAKVKALFEELGTMWAADEAKYDQYVMTNPCPFLTDKTCAIYEIRPDGCKLFPNTTFGMQSTDCQPLNRFKKMRAALKKGRLTKETYYFTEETSGTAKPVTPARFTEKQYHICIARLRKAGIIKEELSFFSWFNEQNKK